MTKQSKKDFYENKKINKVNVNNILVSKKEPYGTNTLLDIMIMILLDHYA